MASYAYCVSSSFPPRTTTLQPVGVTSALTLTARKQYERKGKPVLVAYQSTDMIAVKFFENSITPTSSTSSATSMISPAQTASPIDTQSPTPWPLATRVAIGVTIPLVFFLSALSAWFIFRYRRKRLTTHPVTMEISEIVVPTPLLGHHTTEDPSQIPLLPNPAELPVHSNMSNAGLYTRSELDGNNNRLSSRSELGA